MADEHPNLGDLLNGLLKLLLLQRLLTCVGCGRPNLPNASDAGDWAIQTLLRKIPVSAKCPECQTPEERAECFVEQAIGPRYRLEGLKLVEDPKSTDDDDGGSQARAS